MSDKMDLNEPSGHVITSIHSTRSIPDEATESASRGDARPWLLFFEKGDTEVNLLEALNKKSVVEIECPSLPDFLVFANVHVREVPHPSDFTVHALRPHHGQRSYEAQIKELEQTINWENVRDTHNIPSRVVIMQQAISERPVRTGISPASRTGLLVVVRDGEPAAMWLGTIQGMESAGQEAWTQCQEIPSEGDLDALSPLEDLVIYPTCKRTGCRSICGFYEEASKITKEKYIWPPSDELYRELEVLVQESDWVCPECEEDDSSEGSDEDSVMKDAD